MFLLRKVKQVKWVYEFKHAGWEWSILVIKVLEEIGFEKVESNKCMFILKGENLLYLASYVDDLLLFCDDQNLIKDVIGKIAQNFVIRQFGEADFILGMELIRSKSFEYELMQKKCVQNVLSEFYM